MKFAKMIVGVLGFLLIIGTSRVPAQPVAVLPAANETVVQLTKQHMTTFEATLGTLSESYKVTFVAEGSPLGANLPAAEVSSFMSGQAPLTQVVSKLADAYDYDVERRGTLFLLKKKYTDPSDLPSLTPEECQQSLESVMRVATPFNPNMPPSSSGSHDPLVQEFLDTLSTEQMQALRDKRLIVASLRPAQKDIVRRMSYYLYVEQSLQNVADALGQLKRASHIDFRMGTKSQGLLFGYESLFEGTSIPVFHPLLAAQGASFNTGAQPDVPVKGSEDPSASRAVLSAGATIGSVVTAVNARGDGKRYSIDASLQAKMVTIAGATNTTADNLIKALADVYGLQVDRSDAQQPRLARPRTETISDVMLLPTATRRALPEPLLRALHFDKLDTSAASMTRIPLARQGAPPALSGSGNKKPDDPKSDLAREREQQFKAGEERLHQIKETFQQYMRLKQAPALMENEATQQLNTRIRPSITGQNPTVSLSNLSDADKQIFADLLMAECMEHMQTLLSRKLPDWISNFDDVALSGGRGVSEEGRAYVNLSFYFSVPGHSEPLMEAGYTHFLPPHQTR